MAQGRFPFCTILGAGTKLSLLISHIWGDELTTIQKFGLDEVESVKKAAPQPLHEANVLKIIRLSKQLDQRPPGTVIFGIEPESVKPGQELSETAAAKMDDYIDAIFEEPALQLTLCRWT